MEEASPWRFNGGGGSADSYIGSLINLTSRSEIRYEGILYNINTEESSIGLRNVRSFGTEGRQKDGLQIPSSDKIYEYILFRGSDIKDLQVKSSPPVQAPSPMHDDPAIIQSHYSCPALTATSAGCGGNGSTTELSSHEAHLTRPAFQDGLPLYQPGGIIGSWGLPTSAPNANGSGLAVPTYWQGFYGLSNGLPHVPQQPMPFRPPPGLTIPQAMQQHLLYPGLNAPMQTSCTSLPELSNLTQPVVNPAISASISFPSTLASLEVMVRASETSPSLTLNKAPLASLSSAGASTNLTLTSLNSFTQEIKASVTPIPTKPKPDPVSTLSHQTVSQLEPSIVGAETSVPSLITPDQLLQPAPSSLSNHPVHTGQKDVEVVVSSASLTDSPASVSTGAKGPLLPLPKPSDRKINGAFGVTPINNRGRGRGRGRDGHGAARTVTQFTEDFDFMAMNEKFNKDEVWGHLGKSQAQQRNKTVELEEDSVDDEDAENEGDDACHPIIEIKPVYVKDEFFDSLSCNALDRGYRNNGRTKFSEQMKIDAETFGNFSRRRGGHGGRGAGRRGNFRGSYYGGRGYGYGGRGRGQMASTRGQ